MILRWSLICPTKKSEMEDEFGWSFSACNSTSKRDLFRKPELLPYHQIVLTLKEKLTLLKIEHITRRENTQADALAKLAAALSLPDGHDADIRVEQRWLFPSVLELITPEFEVNMVMCSQVEASDWRYPFFEYFQHGRLPEDPNKRTEFRRRLPIYIYQNHTLYKRSYDQVWLRCL